MNASFGVDSAAINTRVGQGRMLGRLCGYVRATAPVSYSGTINSAVTALADDRAGTDVYAYVGFQGIPGNFSLNVAPGHIEQYTNSGTDSVHGNIQQPPSSDGCPGVVSHPSFPDVLCFAKPSSTPSEQTEDVATRLAGKLIKSNSVATSHHRDGEHHRDDDVALPEFAPARHNPSVFTR